MAFRNRIISIPLKPLVQLKPKRIAERLFGGRDLSAAAVSSIRLGHHHGRVAELLLRFSNVGRGVGFVGAGLRAKVAELELILRHADGLASPIERTP
jgi:hypothetical protein